MDTRIGLVGCGKWGQNILRDLRRLGCCVVVADPSAEARGAAARLGAAGAVEKSLELESCDGYVIASPILTLPAEAEAMLRRKKPVFCEKPLFRTSEEEKRLLDAGAGQNLFAMYKFCYHPGVQALRHIATSGELGEVEALELQRLGWDEDFQGTDALWLVAVHLVSAVWGVLGVIPELRSASVRRHAGIITGASICLGAKRPVTINFSSRHTLKNWSAALYCANGVAVLPDAYASYLSIREDRKGIEKRPFDPEMPLYLELKEFVTYLHGGQKPRCDFAMAASVSTTINLINRMAV